MDQPTTTSTRVRVACERCGVQQLPARAITLRCCDDDGATEVRFACMRCDLVHLDPISAEQATALAACEDVRIETWQQPIEACARPDAPPLVADDLDEWLALLDDDAALHESLVVLREVASRDEAHGCS